MDDRIIFHKLDNDLKAVQREIPVENIFGIFVTEVFDKDIKSEAIIIPSFERVCTGFTEVTRTLDNGRITLFDIRNIYNATAQGHPEVIKSLYTDYLIVNPMYQHIFYKVYKSNRELFKEGAESGIPSNELKKALMKICRMVWNESSDSVRFVKQITDSEKIALESIIELIGDEGIFSQSKAASACGVSRLTMSNLIMKLKFFNIADVEYLGNKGTRVKFIDDIALDIRGLRVPKYF